MYFKPRIFVSSTLSENLSIREKLNGFFQSIGAEIMLYESNLTPSIVPMTYRTDIKDADFVILIIKENYGTKTNSGLSGTHEELKILLENKIPTHVYIKKTKQEKDREELIKEVNRNEISYYYFNDDEELLKRIKETVFIIARDIMNRKVEQTDLNTKSVRIICTNHDYRLALGYLKIFEAMIEIGQKGYFDFLHSNLIIAALDNIAEHRKYNDFIFVDNKLNELLDNILEKYEHFSSLYTVDYETNGKYTEISFPVYGNILVTKSSNNGESKYSEEDYMKIIKEMLKNYNIFKEYIQNMKTDADILCNS